MSYVVPFDGTALSRAALDRATTYAQVEDAGVVAITVVPNDPTYAREKGWVAEGEAFSASAVAADLRSQIATRAPDAAFEWRTVDRYAPPGTIVRVLRELAAEADATVVFVGSENAGRLVTSITSIASGVVTKPAYDVHIVRRPLSAERE